MNGKISVVINTLNEEKNLERAINSVKWADEILVCDMHSDDNSAIVAKKLGAKVILYKRLSFVEPARNFAISKASNEWILVLDPDEEIPTTLADRLKEMVQKPIVSTFVEVPRKNIIFGKWMKASMWWPDYNVRFFKKDSVFWGDKIHHPPKTKGQGIKLPGEEHWAIVHYHYSSVTQFIERMNRYTSIQAEELKEEGYQFNWIDSINRPLSEFLGRYFANRGFKDGLHGLSLSLLQALSFLIVCIKLWELNGFNQEEIKLKDVEEVFRKGGEELDYWFKYGNLSKNPLKAFLQRAKNKLI